MPPVGHGPPGSNLKAAGGTQLRILHILKHTGRANGNVCAMVDLACVQAQSGHDVRVCSAGGHFDDVLARYGVQHIEIMHAHKSPRTVMGIWRVFRALRAFQPDVVHAHMMSSALVAAALQPLLRFKLVTTVHNEFQNSARLMGVGQRVIGVSEAVTRSMIRRGIPASKMRTVLNGSANSPRFPGPPPPPLTLRRPAVLHVGGLHARKGVDTLITAFGEAAQRVPAAHLYLVGSGPQRPDYERLAEQVAPGRVEFCGHIDDPRPYMAGADIFVLASRQDPAPLVLGEARQAGCAIIATNVDGIPEMLDGGAAGILVEPDCPDQIASALSRLLEDPDYLASVRAKARANIANMSVERMAADTETVYRELLV